MRPPGRPGRAGGPAAGRRVGLAGARRGLIAALAAGLACYAVLLGIAAAHRQSATAERRPHGLADQAPPDQLLRRLLGGVEHHGGLRGRDHAAVGDRRRLHGRLAPQKWLTDTLLTKKMPPATFVIVSPGEKLRRSSAVATFGRAGAELPLRPLHDPGLAREPGAADAAGGQAASHANGQRYPA